MKFYYINTGKNIYHNQNSYQYNVAWYNRSNETYDFYTAHSHLAPLGAGFGLRSFGRQFLDSSRFNIAYSLEIGITQFRSRTNFIYAGSSTTDPDSILNAHGGFEFSTDFSMVYFMNYLDFHLNITPKIKWTNSIGVGMMAMFRSKARDFPYQEAVMIDNDRPVILSFSFESQITEKYDNFDVGYFISFTPYGIPLFDEDVDNANGFDDRHKLSKVKFNCLGIRFMPHPKKRKVIDLQGDF
ncbi:hypothetical protein JYT74_01165 [Crocinitomix catalasitica]|nr:hypothetical protein [Crocinitomix catalasitica]